MPLQETNSSMVESEEDFVNESLPLDSCNNISSGPLVVQPKIVEEPTEEVVQVWRQLTANVFGFVKGIIDKYSPGSPAIISKIQNPFYLFRWRNLAAV